MRAFRALALLAGVAFGLPYAARAASDDAGVSDAQQAQPPPAPGKTFVPPAPPTANAPLSAEGEPTITVPGREGDYLRAMHARIHWRWARVFIESPAASQPPLNDLSLSTEILFTVRWDGSPAEVTVSRSSGVKTFDAAAVAAVRGDVPYSVPPVSLYGDDGVAHFRWVFARDRRLCGEGEIRRREDPLEEALPRLFIQGRYKEALLRVSRYMDSGDVNAMNVFARSWLARPFADRIADVSAAAALARLGDRRQIKRLQPGLANADTVVVAARGLAALKVDLCALLDPTLLARDPAATEIAMTALREVGSGPAGGACLRSLGDLAADETAPKALRASALRTFSVLDPAGAHRQVILDLTSPVPELRAAAATASGRPGGGRPALYRLEPLLKDASPDVRAAAAAAIVRACGDISFEYLNPLFKNSDNRPFVAMAPALGELSSPASADLLARILKRDASDTDEAVLRALAARKDEKARAMFKPLAAKAKRSSHSSNALRLFLYANAPLEEVRPLANDPYLGILAYKAMLRDKRHKEAADWLVERFDRLRPEVIGEALGAWLANPPTVAAQ
ncbi:MAG TPA: TonB C-terminal domain-containing protein [Polyangia bacterium]|nr:TonB C-terminal domain-containing protein [Polyangia bacterium]